MQDRTSRSHGQSTGTETVMQAMTMGDLVSVHDWTATPLGHVAGWPDSLKAAVRILITSRFPMWMAWGPELTVLYNDAYARVTLGKKHPWALGETGNRSLARDLERHRAPHRARSENRRGVVG